MAFRDARLIGTLLGYSARLLTGWTLVKNANSALRRSSG
jgi:hypothetical protein